VAEGRPGVRQVGDNPAHHLRQRTEMHHIRFCTTSDDARIAYAVAGKGVTLVKAPNWLNHLELDVASPIWQPWISRMVENYRLVRYDARGCGLSDRHVERSSFGTNLLDLEAVVHAAGLDRFVLYGASQGAAIAIEYAARHPDRVSHLILYGAYLRGAMKRHPSPQAVEEAQTMIKIVQLGWGRENSAFRQVFASQFIPDSTLEQLRAFDEIQRVTASPDTAARLLANFHEIDVSALAALIRCPTLVLHSRDDARIPFEEGRLVAAAIPGAEFIPLDSSNHILLAHQPAWRQHFDEIDAFLQRNGQPARVRFPTLTHAEARVLDLMAEGLSNGEIAAALGIQSKTVRNHINRTFGKLDVRTRAQAIVLARNARSRP
jgi:pimeloyl-ACP methyl ester carboxylesterase/DNA-binding CsgD family transcriptional regulator